jgi:Zn-dependent peptidase ImmA (M78 family)/DNA-binding XRE family transcriptional regulator
MPTVEALITPKVVRWARQRARLSTAEVAKRISVSQPDRLDAWEQEGSEDRPTFRQAQHLADVLHVPFGYLFLSEPPTEELPLPDLRTKYRDTATKPSPEFLEVVYDALRKQEWYHDYLLDQDADPVPFVGRYTETTPVDTVAEDIRRTLRLDQSLRRQARDNDDYFRLLAGRAEEARVVVLRTSIVGNNTRRSLDPEEFQGFAKSDNLAPLVFVNQNDYLSAQIFTLLHELAHIWTGVSGVSDPDYLERPVTKSAVHQRRADQIAAEALVPAKDFALRWDSYAHDEDRLTKLCGHYRVSVFVVLRRAYDVGKLSLTEYLSKYDELRQQIKPKKSGGGGGYGSLFSRNSHTVTAAVLHSVIEGKLPPTEGATLLNVRPPTLYNMERYLASREA